eukprot:UN01100
MIIKRICGKRDVTKTKHSEPTKAHTRNVLHCLLFRYQSSKFLRPDILFPFCFYQKQLYYSHQCYRLRLQVLLAYLLNASF